MVSKGQIDRLVALALFGPSDIPSIHFAPSAPTPRKVTRLPWVPPSWCVRDPHQAVRETTDPWGAPEDMSDELYEVVNSVRTAALDAITTHARPEAANAIGAKQQAALRERRADAPRVV